MNGITDLINSIPQYHVFGRVHTISGLMIEATGLQGVVAIGTKCQIISTYGTKTLAEVVEPRYEELFILIKAEIKRSGFEDQIASGIVLTGGSSTVPGAVELAEEIFHMPVRLGSPQNIQGLVDVVSNPIYSTAVGLLQYGCQQEVLTKNSYFEDSSLRGVFNRMRSWFQGW